VKQARRGPLVDSQGGSRASRQEDPTDKQLRCLVGRFPHKPILFVKRNGNESSHPSKSFRMALCYPVILTSQTEKVSYRSGSDTVHSVEVSNLERDAPLFK